MDERNGFRVAVEINNAAVENKKTVSFGEICVVDV